MLATLLASIASLAAWLVLGFIHPISSGNVHLLLALACILWVRWFALRT